MKIIVFLTVLFVAFISTEQQQSNLKCYSCISSNFGDECEITNSTSIIDCIGFKTCYKYTARGTKFLKF